MDFAGGSGQRRAASDAGGRVPVEEVRPEVHQEHPENQVRTASIIYVTANTIPRLKQPTACTVQELLPVPGQAVRRQEEGGVAPGRPQPPHRL